MATGYLVFGWIDYTIFSGLLGISLIIGVYFGFFSQQNSVSEYLFGGKTMHYFPVAISIIARFVFLKLIFEINLFTYLFFCSINTKRCFNAFT